MPLNRTPSSKWNVGNKDVRMNKKASFRILEVEKLPFSPAQLEFLVIGRSYDFEQALQVCSTSLGVLENALIALDELTLEIQNKSVNKMSFTLRLNYWNINKLSNQKREYKERIRAFSEFKQRLENYEFYPKLKFLPGITQAELIALVEGLEYAGWIENIKYENWNVLFQLNKVPTLNPNSLSSTKTRSNEKINQFIKKFPSPNLDIKSETTTEDPNRISSLNNAQRPNLINRK